MDYPTTPLAYTAARQPWAYSYLHGPVAAVCPALTVGMRVLDIGCGCGYWSNEFAQKGCKVVGIDPSTSGIAVAKKCYPTIRFEQLTVSEDICEQLGEVPFDLVVSLEVVEHLYSPRTWARGCFNALRPGGILICSTPYHGYLKNLALGIAGRWDSHWSSNDEGGHIKFWSRSSLVALLCEAGFRRDRITFRGAGRVPFAWKSMILRASR